MPNELGRKRWERLHVPNCRLIEYRLPMDVMQRERVSYEFRYYYYEDFGGFEVVGRFTDELYVNRLAVQSPITLPELGKHYDLDVLLTSISIEPAYGRSPLATRPNRPTLNLEGSVLRDAGNAGFTPSQADLVQMIKELSDGSHKD